MTREQINKWWPVIVAFNEGKTIEVNGGSGNWKEIHDPNFCLEHEYRIKSEPEYVPFDFSDASFIIGGVVKSKRSGNLRIIVSVDIDGVVAGFQYMTFENLYKWWTFTDGKPFGKLKK